MVLPDILEKVRLREMETLNQRFAESELESLGLAPNYFHLLLNATYTFSPLTSRKLSHLVHALGLLDAAAIE